MKKAGPLTSHFNTYLGNRKQCRHVIVHHLPYLKKLSASRWNSKRDPTIIEIICFVCPDPRALMTWMLTMNTTEQNVWEQRAQTARRSFRSVAKVFSASSQRTDISFNHV